MAKRMIIVVGGVAVLLGAILGWNALKGHFIAQAMAKMGDMPQTVSAMPAQKEVWRPTLQAVGSLRAVKGVDVTTELGGLVTAINFQSGDRVKAGDLLVQLDVSADKAQLQGLEAAAKLAEINYRRDKELIKKQAVSTSKLQEDESKLEDARAAVAQQKAMIAKKTIRAPFAGHLGVRQVDLGQYVGPGTKIVTLQALKPIYVDFSLPQQDVGEVQQGQLAYVTLDAFPGKKFEAKINAVEPKVDPKTRNFDLQATLPNDAELLRPGMFADVEVALPQQPQYITLPQTAITYNPYGDFVYVVKQAGKDEQGKPVLRVHQRFVDTGPTRGDQVAILKGVKPGEQIVTAGQLKLKEGTRVAINNSVQPPNSKHPHVEEQ